MRSYGGGRGRGHRGHRGRGHRGRGNRGNHRGARHYGNFGNRDHIDQDWIHTWWNPLLREAKHLAEIRLQQPPDFDYAYSAMAKNGGIPRQGIETEATRQIKALGDLLKRLNTELVLPHPFLDPQDLSDLIVNLSHAMPRQCAECGGDSLLRFIHHNFCRFVSVACVKQRMTWESDILDIAIRNVFDLVVMGHHLGSQENLIEALRSLSYLLAEKCEVHMDPDSNGLNWPYVIQTLVALASEGFNPLAMANSAMLGQDGSIEFQESKAFDFKYPDLAKARERNVNIRRFACICLGNLVAHSGTTLVEHQKLVFRAVIHVFSFLAKVLQNRYRAKTHKYPAVMTTVLKAMCNLMNEWRQCSADYLPLLCSTLRSLILYGTPLAKLTALGKTDEVSGDTETESPSNTDTEASTRESHDFSYSMDIDHDSDEGDRASKLRMMVLTCLSSIARADAKLFHDHWLQFLPSNIQDAIRQRPFSGCNMLTVVVHDPCPRVRTQALSTLASFFEKNNLSNIAGKLDKPNKLAFDSLSTRYARILHALHHALVYVLRHETQSIVKVQALKTLNALVLNTTYRRLSPGLLKLVAAASVEIMKTDPHSNLKYSLWTLLTAVFGSNNMDTAHKELMPFLAWDPPKQEILDEALAASTGSGKVVSTGGPKPLPLRPSDGQIQRDPPNTRELRSLLQVLLEDAINRAQGYHFDEPYPDARTVISKLSRSYRFCLTPIWKKGLYNFLLSGFRSNDPTVVVETLKVVEQWIIPVSEATQICSTREEAVCGLMALDGARALLAKELPQIFARFSGMEQRATTLRSRVLAVLAVFRVWHWQGFAKDARRTFLTLAYNSTFDESESVRTAGARALGVLMTFDLEYVEYYEKACTRLIALLESNECAKQTKIRASWALANICDLHVNVHHQHPEEPDPETIPGFELTVRPCLVDLVSPNIVGKLIDTCFEVTTKDSPKIIANAIRAVGNIGHWLPLDDPKEEGMSEQVWVAICMVLSREMAKEKNTHKAKWNACYATGNVLSNEHMPRIKTPEAKRYTLELYRTLLEVLGTSVNFKVRINAVQALTAPPTRKHYGAIFGSLWVMLLNCLRNLQENNNVKKYVEIKYQLVLAKKLSLAVFHMIDLCSPRDLKNVQVASVLGQHTKVLALMLVERHRELWQKEQFRDTATTPQPKPKTNFYGASGDDNMVSADVMGAYKKVRTLLGSLETEEGKRHLATFLHETKYFNTVPKESATQQTQAKPQQVGRTQKPQQQSSR